MTEEAPITITLKSGKDYNDSWLVLRAATTDQATQLLRELYGSTLLEGINSTAQQFQASKSLTNSGVKPQPAPQQPAPPQQPQQQTQQQGGAQLHPAGKTCDMCSEVLQWKPTKSGKGRWLCPAWRWNNGNPNGHTQEWAS